ncbi:MAG: hypothetical protein NVV74_14330 [Magnetospirillum sp.]|nr:hypothetical protein [Magnetospirillum sp.]
MVWANPPVMERRSKMDVRLPALTPLRGGLRRHLVVLVLAPLIPMLLWAGGLTVWSSLQERAALERGLAEAARALTIAVDQEIRLTIAALDSAALSRTLAAHDIPGFAPMARQLAAIHSEWGALLLFNAAGQQVFMSREILLVGQRRHGRCRGRRRDRAGAGRQRRGGVRPHPGAGHGRRGGAGGGAGA